MRLGGGWTVERGMVVGRWTRAVASSSLLQSLCAFGFQVHSVEFSGGYATLSHLFLSSL